MGRDFDDNEFPLAYLLSFRWERARPARPLRCIDDTSPQQPLIERAIRQVCFHRGYWLRAMNVHTDEVHTVVSAATQPESVLEAFQTHATRKLNEAGLLTGGLKPSLPSGSTPYLWKERHVVRAIDYVLNGQNNEPPSFDD